jgi:hypothetical protein
MNTLFNSLKNLKERNSKIVLKKELNSIRLKMRKSNRRNLKQNLNHFVNTSKKSLETKLRNVKSVSD